jgi:hypothetical protein
VRAIAISTGKKSANTGSSIVPSPNPEKNVSMAVTKARMIIMNSILQKQKIKGKVLT